ncbi:PA domain-containing protein [Massilia sp. TS11]|uniref:PA domain-containing protein n=1 Tax=Massilia sp. TS11 TaxID=2908003 RepID=UPI001EDAB1D4|nr:PA domain-containing protein [Massilia sp. TS11]MCG2584388.1 peptidase [Massilia sp. TS11]
MKTAKVLLALGAALSFASASAATIQVINTNAPGIGFNDPTPAAPVGGNAGTTLGQQRLIAFQHAANVWGAELQSEVPIRVAASFEPLACTANSAVLGAAGATMVYANFAHAPKADTWYPVALADKLAGQDLNDSDTPHIEAVFNANLGLRPDCMPGNGFYLGLDNQHGNQVDLVSVLLHELGHGLGFQDFTDGEDGSFLAGMPSVWDHFLMDNNCGKLWVNMTAQERVASAVSNGRLVWTGQQVYQAAPEVLLPSPRLTISGLVDRDLAGDYEVGDASFGPPLSAKGVKGQLKRVIDQTDGRGLACTRLDYVNAIAVRGGIAVVDRGTCPFTTKALNVQAAGALGMIVVDNQPGPAVGMSGSDPAITIPSVRMARDDGLRLEALLAKRPRFFTLVTGNLNVNPQRLAGADRAGRVQMYTPPYFAQGSSVSHYTDAARRNLLMEPFINDDLRHAVKRPYDLTKELLKDIGW